MDTKGLVRALGEESLLRHVRTTSACVNRFRGQAALGLQVRGINVKQHDLTSVLTTGCIQFMYK